MALTVVFWLQLLSFSLVDLFNVVSIPAVSFLFRTFQVVILARISHALTRLRNQDNQDPDHYEEMNEIYIYQICKLFRMAENYSALVLLDNFSVDIWYKNDFSSWSHTKDGKQS